MAKINSENAKTIIAVYVDIANWIDIDSFPLPPTSEDNFYMSIWNTNHRPYVPGSPEIADTVFYTTKETLLKVLEVDVESENIKGDWPEQFFYMLLNYLDIDIIFDHNIHTSLMREDNMTNLS